MRFSKAVYICTILCTGMLLFSGTPVLGGAKPERPQEVPSVEQALKKGGTLTVAVNLDFQTLDAQTTTTDPTPEAMVNVFEGLLAFDKNMRPAPDLAESYKISGDQLTWTFSLRRGVLFHNGKEMTSADTKASLERWKKVSPNGSYLKDLQAINTPDEYTMQLVFAQPIGSILLTILADEQNLAAIMPKEIADVSERGKLTEVVGTGPYQYVEYRPDDYLKLKRFENYFSRTDPSNYKTGRKTAFADEVIFRIVPESSTRVAGLSTGEFDIIRALPDTDFNRVKDNPALVPFLPEPPHMDIMSFNFQKGPFASVDMRRAVQAVVNVEEVVRSMVSAPEFGRIDPSMFSKISPYYNTAGAEYYNQNNLQKAKELVAKAGYKGETIKFLALTPDPINYRACIAVAEQMKRAGMNVEIVPVDIGSFVALRRDPDGMHMFSTQLPFLDPSLTGYMFAGKWPGDKTASSFPEIQEIYAQLLLESEYSKRLELTKKLQLLIYQNAAYIPVGYHYRAKARRAEIMDQENNLGFNLGPAYNIWINRR